VKAVSVVLSVRNEYPTILGTIYAFYEDLITWLEPDDFEFVVVDNCSKDSTAAILSDKFRRWTSKGLMKVIRFDERPGNVVARNVGAKAAEGEVVIFADGHLSLADGFTKPMVEGARHGGCWHPAFQVWGDPDNVRCYGYELRLKEKFWGNISRHVPKSIPRDAAGRPAVQYQVPMASHCCLAVRRDEFLELGGYGDKLRVYGGGEPLLNLKYWVVGSSVHVEPRALVRHCAFGTAARWQANPRARKLEKNAGNVTVRRQGDPAKVEMTKEIQAGDEHLAYGRDYAWTNEDKDHNFMAAAFITGGYEWLQRIYRIFWDKRWGVDKEGNRLSEPAAERYLDDLNKLRRDVLRDCAGERAAVEARTVRTLDDLLANPPWPV
jgi:glycosyltransferase involved in cell wall biosynthesis